ncbi:uncharacterized protein [Epargyreus clarus]|uniref:uncharacterized protein n=1 Tax=Epargyreus clarus TaxID=520877 RepID=UPI003C2E8E69
MASTSEIASDALFDALVQQQIADAPQAGLGSNTERLTKIQHLSRRIVFAITTGKSVSSENKKLVINLAKEIETLSRETMVAVEQCDVIADVKASIENTIKSEISKINKPTPTIVSPPTYAQMVSSKITSPPTVSRLPKSKPSLIVYPSSEERSRKEVTEQWRRNINFKEVTYAPASVQPVGRNRLRVEFDSVDQRDETLKRLENTSAEIRAEPSRKLRPMVILKGVFKETATDELTRLIVQQNPEVGLLRPTAEDLQYRFVRRNKNDKLYNAVLLASPCVWRKIIELGRLNVDHQKVHVEEFVPLLQCFKCLQFGHLRKHCTKDDVLCAHCGAENHTVEKCPSKDKSEEANCSNCVSRGKRLGTSFDTKHSANSDRCPIRDAMRSRCNLGRGYNSEQEFLKYISDKSYDIAFISEPYVGSKNNMRNIQGYELHQFTSDSRVKAAIAIRSGLGSAIGITKYSNTNVCTVQITHNSHKFFLVSVYIEPKSDDNNTLNFLDILFQHIDQSHAIICGDFNGWHPIWGSSTSNKRGREILNLIVSHNLTVCNEGSEPTFEAYTSDTVRTSIIDLTIASDITSSKIRNWKVNPEACPTSEHHAIDFTLDLNKNKLKPNKTQSTYRYNTTGADWNLVKETLKQEIEVSSLDATVIKKLNISELDVYISSLTCKIQTACDTTLKRKRSKKIQTIPWWNDELEHLKRKAVFLHHRLQDLKRKGKPLVNILAERQTAKETYRLALSKASSEHFRNFCSRQGKEDVWTLTNRLLKHSPQPSPPTTLNLGNSNFTNSSEESACALLDRFYPIDTPDDLEIQKLIRLKANTYPATDNEVDFTLEEVRDCMLSMDSHKAPGPDHLTADICSTFMDAFPEVITQIMNRCLHLSHFPTSWKKAFIKTVPKPNKIDYNDISSYRPIGLLDVFGKLLEKLIARRLIYHLNITSNLNQHQYGFREQRSTNDALAEAMKQINNAKSSGKLVIGVSLDIKGAFDHAWWPALMYRLHVTGCPLNIYKLIKSYISNRTVTLNYADASVDRYLSRGCIQGSVLGPIFWNIILDELLNSELPPTCHLQAYADDLLLIVSANSVSKIETDANDALKVITEWGRRVKLEFAASKTQAISFSAKANKYGSKHDGLVGAAFVVYHPNGDSVTKKLKLHSSSSVFQAEMLAIQRACEYCVTKGIVDAVIFSDSLSALLEIQNINSTNATTVQIHQHINRILNFGTIKFVWIKSHVGLAGNEMADQAAKAAASQHKSCDFPKFPLSFVKYQLKSEIDRLSDEIYQAAPKGAHTRLWCPNIGTIRELLKSTKLTFQLTQILTGHGYHLHYLHRFKIVDSDKCPCDENSTQSIDHLLKICPIFANSRQDHEFKCNMLNIEPYNLTSLLTRDSCIQSFVDFCTNIVNRLKELNNT